MKFKSLESLRGIAAILVALFHSRFVVNEKHVFIDQSAIFVDFFFILSGFVIAYAYTYKVQGGLGFKKFITLRFGRLYPLHIFLLVLWGPYILAKGYAFHELGLGNAPYVDNNIYSFLSNLFLVNSMGIHGNLSWNYPAWSISVEFFTYIFFFFFIALTKTMFSSIYLLLVSFFSYGILYVLTDSSLLSTFEFGFIRCLGGFFLGAWLYHSFKNISLPSSYIGSSILEIAIVLSTIILVSISSSKQDQLAIIASFAGVIFIFSVQNYGVISKVLNHRFMIYLGSLSYSIYMIHAIIFAVAGNIYQYVLKLPVKLIAREDDEPLKYFDIWYADIINVFCLVIIIFLSTLTYKYIERPWRSKFREHAKKAR